MPEVKEGAEVQVALAAKLNEVELAKQELEDRARILEVEKENYKEVALRRKGKLEKDESFFGEHTESDIVSVIGNRVALTQKEIEADRKIRIALAEKAAAEAKLAEVLRAKDNTPPSPTGGGSGGGQEVKDSIFSEAQEASFKNKWTRMGFSEETQKRMLETEKKNALARRNIP